MSNDNIAGMRTLEERSAGNSKTFSEINNYALLAQCGYCSKCHFFNYLKNGICEKCAKEKTNEK